MNQIMLDFEWRSAVNLKQHGTDRYFRCPHSRPLMAAWKLDTAPTRLWFPGEPCPPEMAEAVRAGALVKAHNNQFERQAWQIVMTPLYGWPELDLEQCTCTAAKAAAMGLPRDLESLGVVLNLPVQKDKEGKRLIQKFCVPKKQRGSNAIEFNDPEDYPEDFARFCTYCIRDVEVEFAADNLLMALSQSEEELWRLDQTINQRGIRIDIESVRAAWALCETYKATLNQHMRAATGNMVETCSQLAKITAWIKAQGVELPPSMARADLIDFLADETVPDSVRNVIELRQEAAKTSTTKLPAMLRRASADGRVRNALLFDGASTGRWASLGFQVHNMQRPSREFENAKLDLAILFKAIRLADPGILRFFYGDPLGNPLRLIADAMRSFIWAAPDHDLIAADYSGIEGVVCAWLSGHLTKLEAMRAINADPSLPDLYRRAAARIFNTSTDIITRKDTRRQVGKVAELALQYGGAQGALASMCRNYDVHLEDTFEPLWEAASEDAREAALDRYDACRSRGEPSVTNMSMEAWLAAELIKVPWRLDNEPIVLGWRALEKAARDAVAHTGQSFQACRCTFYRTRTRDGKPFDYLWIVLPSGRPLAYAQPRLKPQVYAQVRLPDGTWSEAGVMDETLATIGVAHGSVFIVGPAKAAVTCAGVDSQTRKVKRYALYGGLTMENVTQAVARDLLANGLVEAERGGYPVVFHVHDEVIAEVRKWFGSVADFCRRICKLPPWAKGMPLVASGWRGKRYRKG